MNNTPELVEDENGRFIFCEDCGVGLRVGHETDPNYHFRGCRKVGS